MKTIVTGESDWTLPNTSVTAFPSMVDAPQAQVDSDGQKYILAGTPLAASSDPTQSSKVNVMTPTNDPSKVQGVLRWDLNVAKGPQPGSVVNGGLGNIANMDPKIQQIYTADFQKQLKQQLPRLQFINRE